MSWSRIAPLPTDWLGIEVPPPLGVTLIFLAPASRRLSATSDSLCATRAMSGVSLISPASLDSSSSSEARLRTRNESRPDSGLFPRSHADAFTMTVPCIQAWNEQW